MFYFLSRKTCTPYHHWVWDWVLVVYVHVLSAKKHKKRGNILVARKHKILAIKRFLMVVAFSKQLSK